MARYPHPRLDDVPLEAALHALADPCRLGIVRRLADEEGELSCQSAAKADDVPRSTLSNHFKILRGAGLIRTRPAGREYLSSLRREEFDDRFPGLLDPVLRQPRR
jgi:DNA-binding transcriptional ArsR family regulator